MRRSFCRAPGAGARSGRTSCGRSEKTEKQDAARAASRYVAGSLKLRFPQPMQIAVCKYRDRLIVHNLEVEFRRFTRLKAFALTAAFGFDIYPLDVMVLAHRMGRAADFHIDVLAVDCDDGKVFFRGRLNRVGFHFLHFFAAADHGHLAVINQPDEIPTVFTDEKFLHSKHCKYLLHSI